MTRRLAVLALLLAAASTARAKDEPAPAPKADAAPHVDPAEARRRAIALDKEALAAFRAGDAAKAAELWKSARDLQPAERVLAYDLGVASEAAGDRAAAAAAYRAALSGARDDVEARALFNAGALALDDAFNAAALLDADQGQLKSALATQATDPDGEKPSDAKLDEALKSFRTQAVQSGLASVKTSLEHLQELVRRTPDDAEVLHNLELAQRVRKRLEKEQEQQEQEGRSDKQDDPDKQRDKNTGEKGGDQREGDPGDQDETSQKPDDGGEQGKTDEGKHAEHEDARPEEGKAEEMTQDQAERLLQQMLEAAARRAREVREQRAARVKRSPVEKDW